MSKPTTYRGVPYYLFSGPSLRPIDRNGFTLWYGMALFNGHLEIIYEGRHRLKADALKAVKAAICARLGCPDPVSLNKARRKAAKLREMTVKRGCTPAEAENAREKLRKLERRA
jgi:hypothetical protein